VIVSTDNLRAIADEMDEAGVELGTQFDRAAGVGR